MKTGSTHATSLIDEHRIVRQQLLTSSKASGCSCVVQGRQSLFVLKQQFGTFRKVVTQKKSRDSHLEVQSSLESCDQMRNERAVTMHGCQMQRGQTLVVLNSSLRISLQELDTSIQIAYEMRNRWNLTLVWLNHSWQFEEYGFATTLVGRIAMPVDFDLSDGKGSMGKWSRSHNV